MAERALRKTHALHAKRGGASPVDLDRVIHERVRLAIVSALAASEALSFNELKTLLETTDGNLSVHARRLEEAGYVTCHKSFEGRVPRTEFRLTTSGRRAFEKYLDHCGSVEARVMGRTVGIAPVREGAANVVVRVESSRRHEVAVTLHYLPDAPWWRPGPPLEARVTTVSPASWTRWTWIALAGLVAGWTVLAWRRPRGRATRELPKPPLPPGRPKLELVQRVAPNSGWTGRVLDAHDGQPIARAELQILGPSFRGSATQHSTTTAHDGTFSLPPVPLPWPEGIQLRVTGVFHATLEQPLPPEGEVLVHLTTRRRALLQRLSKWVERRGAPYSQPLDPTPGEVAAVGERQGEPAVAEWARGIEGAAYGPAPPSADLEESLVKREPGS